MSFQRTVCDCARCKSFCKAMPGCCIPQDLERISLYLELPLEAVECLFCASPGGVVKNTQTGKLYRVPTIVPARKANGECVFLDANSSCTIHPVAPFGCAYFDDHLATEEANERSKAMLLSIVYSEEGFSGYRATWNRLYNAGRLSISPEQARTILANRFDEQGRPIPFTNGKEDSNES